MKKIALQIGQAVTQCKCKTLLTCVAYSESDIYVYDSYVLVLSHCNFVVHMYFVCQSYIFVSSKTTTYIFMQAIGCQDVVLFALPNAFITNKQHDKDVGMGL